MYLIHYVFVVWLQYALLGVALFAIAKASIVFAVTVIASWGTIVAVRRLPLGASASGRTPGGRAAAKRSERSRGATAGRQSSADAG